MIGSSNIVWIVNLYLFYAHTMENYFNRIIELFVKHNTSPDLRGDFYEWLIDEKNSEEKDKALYNIWSSTEDGNLKKVSPKTQESLDSVYRKISNRQNKVKIRILRLWQVSAACLFIALLSTTMYFTLNKAHMNTDLIEQFVPIAEMTQLTLSDGTEVLLNSTSTLLYPVQFVGENRSVYLIGEANFKVAKNEKQPFIIKSNDFQVTALGTEFNMKIYPDDPIQETTLLEGSVEIKYNNMKASVILKPNEQFSYDKQNGKETVKLIDLNDVTAWQKGELVFKSATLEEIINVLERKHPYKFVYTLNALQNDRYTFRFKDTTPLQEIMDIIVEVSGNIKYRVEENKYYISPL